MKVSAAPLADLGVISALHLDDSVFDRQRMKRLFEETGLSLMLTQCSDPEAFGRALDADKFEVVFLDYNLPGTTGLDVMKAVQNHAKNKDASVILITNQEQAELALKALREGASDYLVKASLSAQTLERATVSSVQKTRLKLTATSARADTAAIEATLGSFADACAQEMLPMLARMTRQIRSLKSVVSETPDILVNTGDIEKTCARMHEFLMDLAGLSDDGNLAANFAAVQPQLDCAAADYSNTKQTNRKGRRAVADDPLLGSDTPSHHSDDRSGRQQKSSAGLIFRKP